MIAPALPLQPQSAYENKIRAVNGGLLEIGMGRYQWRLFFVAGLGYFSDNLWPIVTGLILPVVVNEFRFNGPFLKLGQNVGLLVGAAFWGFAADIWGRKISFNTTLLITGIFALVAGASPNYVALTFFAALWSFGVGGNLPVDSAIFLEFLPAPNQYLLTTLSVWWAFGQLIGSLIAWPLIATFSCPSGVEPCLRSENMGWRYFLFTMGGIMLCCWAIRLIALPFHESPKFLVGKGRDQEAVDVLHEVAAYNGVTTYLRAIDIATWGSNAVPRPKVARFEEAEIPECPDVSLVDRVRALFSGPQMALSTSLLICIWALIGLAFPLYNSFVTYYLATRGVDFGDGSTYLTYRNQVIISIIGVPGAIIGGYMVELPQLGRRGTLSLFTILTGIFILASTTARTSGALLGWNCAYSLTSNIMYGVLYALTPELFFTKHRGTGNALTATANRVFGVMAPIIALYADLDTAVPVFVAGTIFVGVGFLPLFLPFEMRGRAAM